MHLTAPRLIIKQSSLFYKENYSGAVWRGQAPIHAVYQSGIFIHVLDSFLQQWVKGEAGWASFHLWQMRAWRLWKECNNFCAQVDIPAATLTIIQDFACLESTGPTVWRHSCKCQNTWDIGTEAWQKAQRKLGNKEEWSLMESFVHAAFHDIMWISVAAAGRKDSLLQDILQLS